MLNLTKDTKMKRISQFVTHDEEKDIYHISNEITIDVCNWGIIEVDHNGLSKDEYPSIVLKLAIPGNLLKPSVINVKIPDVLLDGTYEAEVESIEIPVMLNATTEENSSVKLSEKVVANRATGVISYIRKKLINILEEK